MYFDPSEVRMQRSLPPYYERGFHEEPQPGVGVAWFSGDTDTMMTPIPNLKLFVPLLRNNQIETIHQSDLSICIDLFLANAEESDFHVRDHLIQNPQIVDYILSQPIVIERSPPFTITLKGLCDRPEQIRKPTFQRQITSETLVAGPPFILSSAYKQSKQRLH
jgi:hypothetical protein